VIFAIVVSSSLCVLNACACCASRLTHYVVCGVRDASAPNLVGPVEERSETQPQKHIFALVILSINHEFSSDPYTEPRNRTRASGQGPQ